MTESKVAHLAYASAFLPCSVHHALWEDLVVVAIALGLMVTVVHCAGCPLDWDGVRRHGRAAAATVAAMLMERTGVASRHGGHLHGGGGERVRRGRC